MKPIRPRESHFHHLSALLSAPRSLTAVHWETQVPEDIGKWLGKLKLLYGVPFNYIVPDEKMLPRDSIRFFHVDLNWIYSLLEGAFSIGRSTTGDAAHDSLFTNRVHGSSEVAARYVRNPNRAGALRNTADAMNREGLEANGTDEKLTGFLLRSPVVEGWSGLEILAWDASGGKLPPPLRMDRIGDSILIYIVEGVIARMEIREPAEGLHFGVDAGAAPCGVRSLRYVTVPAGAPAGAAPGDQIIGATPVPVPCRPAYRGGSGRVLKVAELAGSVAAALGTLKANNEPGGVAQRPFTSAEFAMQMVEGARSVRFNNVQPPGGGSGQLVPDSPAEGARRF